MVDTDGVHALMTGVSGVGKTAYFLYPRTWDMPGPRRRRTPKSFDMPAFYSISGLISISRTSSISSIASISNVCFLASIRYFVMCDLEWAKRMRELLLEINDSHNRRKPDGCFQKLVLQAYHLRYDNIVSDRFAANVVPTKPKRKRGRAAKGKIVCLLERLRDFKADILRFASDWSVPFTNNEAERTIRFSKVKQKVSGCFRTVDGAEEYARIMSYISTTRKHGVAYFEAVKCALCGNALTLVEEGGSLLIWF